MRVILYHLFNGLRVTLIDMGVLVERQKLLFAVAVILWLVSWFAIGAVMFTRIEGLALSMASVAGGGV